MNDQDQSPFIPGEEPRGSEPHEPASQTPQTPPQMPPQTPPQTPPQSGPQRSTRPAPGPAVPNYGAGQTQPTYGRPAQQGYYSQQQQRPPMPPQKNKSILGTMVTIFGVLAFLGLGIVFLVFLVGVVVKVVGERGGTGGLSLGSKIGLVRIEGMIMPGPETEFWLQSMRDLMKQSSVKGVVLYINSPGGSVGASQELQSMVLRMRENKENPELSKPVYVAMGDLAASGGYYVAAGADRIYSLKGTLTGSIGVLMSKPEISGLVEKLGIDMETIKTGRFKDAGAMTRELSPEEREMFNTLIMSTYNQFLDDIVANQHRKARLVQASVDLPMEKWDAYKFDKPYSQEPREFLTAIADGRAYTGEQAYELGLVDEIGTLDKALIDMATEVGISGYPEIQQPSRKQHFFDMLGSTMSEILPSATQSPLQYRMQLP